MHGFTDIVFIGDSGGNQRGMDEVASLLDRRFGITAVKYHRKPSASKPAAPEIIQEMAEECDYVIVGVGD